MPKLALPFSSTIAVKVMCRNTAYARGRKNMRLYRYRNIENALKEISYGTLYFAASDELNDPVEGYLCLYWQGDKAAWEGLFKNYICGVHQALELYLLAGTGEDIAHKSIMIDITRFDKWPIGGILRSLRDEFVCDETIQNIAKLYGNNKLKVRRNELLWILQMIHNKALCACVKDDLRLGCIPEDQAKPLISSLEKSMAAVAPPPLEMLQEYIESGALTNENRAVMVDCAEEIYLDAIEQMYLMKGSEDDSFLYRCKMRTADISDDVSASIQHRNWLSVVMDFPRLYIDQIITATYPENFSVCLSAKPNNSAMWGNYADQHRGICFVYELENGSLGIEIEKSANADREVPDGMEVRYSPVKAKKITYGGELVERNFFESLGRLNGIQYHDWMTGMDGVVSECVKGCNDEWREQYWKDYETVTYSKLQDWAYEEEYRVVLRNLFYAFSREDEDGRKLRYDPKALKAVIFGINTSEYDKERIIRAIAARDDLPEDFMFQQAKYDELSQEIRIRDKNMWKLKR